MERELFTAHLSGKRLIATPSQTYLLNFTLESGTFQFLPGQFISLVIESAYPEGHPKAGQPRQETRAYSLADAAHGNVIQLCLNRIGSFSNMLCDLEMDAPIQFHGPHGTFTRRDGQEPSLYFGADAGIVPIRSILRDAVPANSSLMQSAATREDLLFRDEFASAAGLRYLPLVAPEQTFVEQQIRRLLTSHPEIRTAYLCGLNAAIGPVRDLLKSLGWDRKQIVFERYD